MKATSESWKKSDILISYVVFAFLLVVRVQDIVNSFRHEFYLVEGSRHRNLDQVAKRSANSGLSRATVSEISYAQFLSKRQGC